MKKISLLIIFLFLLFVGKSVYAEDNTCDAKTRNELSTLASNITISYEIETKTESVSAEQAAIDGVTSASYDYINIKIYNLSSKLRIDGKNDRTGSTFTINYRYIGQDGAVTIPKLLSSITSNYVFEVYGIDTCSTTKLRTFKMTVPRYNYLADMEICSDIQDYYLCQPLVTYDIDDDVAYKQIENYANKVSNSQEENKTNTNGSTISKKISKLSNNKKYVALIVVLVGAFITLLILKRKRSDR